MFTGLIADVGTVRSVDSGPDGAVIEVSTALAGELGEGDSIAVNGVCLTAVAIDDARFSAQAMNETLRRSSLGELETGSPVNLELALRAGDRLGGHVVQGHVDGTAVVAQVREEGFSRVLRLELQQDLGRYLVEKGSVAVDGVSLTVSSLGEDWFEVSLIPETLEHTSLGAARAQRTVNIEVDILAKHVERLLEART